MINILSFVSVMKQVWYVLLAIIILLIMITIHEFGHYIVGKIFKFGITEFSIGMGPAIYKHKKKNGELFSIRLLPLGGFCSFKGEDDTMDEPDAFNNKKPWQRILVLLAGATMNFILSLIVIILMLGVYGQSVFTASDLKPYRGEEQIYNAKALEEGDCVLAIRNGKKTTEIFMTTDFITALNGCKKGDIVYVTVSADGKTFEREVAVREDVNCENLTDYMPAYTALGIGTAPRIQTDFTDENTLLSDDYIIRFADNDTIGACTRVYTLTDIYEAVKDKEEGYVLELYVSRNGALRKTPVSITIGSGWENVDKQDEAAVTGFLGIKSFILAPVTNAKSIRFGPLRTISRSFRYAFVISGTIFRTLGQLLTGKLALNTMGGTVTTIVTASKIVSYGFEYFLEIMAYIGVNLAVFNLLPIPALDGSRIVFCLIEWVRGKPVNRKVEAIIHAVGFIVILGFAILVDVLHLF